MGSFAYHPEAEAEAIAALDWYAARSLPAAQSFERLLTEAELQVAEHPNRWPRCLHGTRYFRLADYPYVLVYLAQPDRILGIAVAHPHRRPGYWKDRLPKQL